MGILTHIRDRAGDVFAASAFATESKSAGVLGQNDVLADVIEAHRVAGENVSHKTAIQVSAVMCCARVIAEGLAQVPCKVFKEDTDGSPIEARDHPLFNLLSRKPNDWQTSFELREQIGLHLVLTNNAFVFVNRNASGQPIELFAFEPGSVTVTQNSDYSISYRVSQSKRKFLEFKQDQIWHLRGPSWNGFQGMDAVHLARKAIGLSQATEKFGAKLFENGARPGGLLTTRAGGAPLSVEQRQQVIDLWKKQNSGADNAHKTVMLPFDLDFTPIAGTADEAQWIESRKFLIEEICRFFRVLPIMVMQSENSSYASVEQLFLAHLTHTLMPWYERFEQSADNALLSDAERIAGYCIKLNANALLRGSTAERAAFYQTMVTLGVMSPNEVRAKEDLPRSKDPEADKLRGAANLFGSQPAAPQAPAKSPTEQNDNGVTE